MRTPFAPGVVVQLTDERSIMAAFTRPPGRPDVGTGEASKDPPTANLGGDMGWFPIDRFGTAVATALGSLKANNEVSQPFQTDVGWHILQLLGKRDADRTVETQREQARELIRQRKAEDEIESTLRQFRSDSYICAVDPAYVTKERQACSGAAIKKAESK